MTRRFLVLAIAALASAGSLAAGAPAFAAPEAAVTVTLVRWPYT